MYISLNDISFRNISNLNIWNSDVNIKKRYMCRYTNGGDLPTQWQPVSSGDHHPSINEVSPSSSSSAGSFFEVGKTRVSSVSPHPVVQSLRFCKTCVGFLCETNVNHRHHENIKAWTLWSTLWSACSLRGRWNWVLLFFSLVLGLTAK